jgi:hypothetical protein
MFGKKKKKMLVIKYVRTFKGGAKVRIPTYVCAVGTVIGYSLRIPTSTYSPIAE